MQKPDFSYEISDLKNCIYVFGSAVAALARIEGMKAENKQREIEGKSLAYVEKDFEKVINDQGLWHNPMTTTIYHGGR